MGCLIDLRGKNLVAYQRIGHTARLFLPNHRIYCLMKKVLFVLLISIGAIASAQIADDELTQAVNAADPTLRGEGCVVFNAQGALTGGFLGWLPGEGLLAILVDPAASGDPGDPGCAADLNDGRLYQLESVTFNLADETLFSAGDGIGDLVYDITIHPLAVPGDPTQGPAAPIATERVNLTTDGSGFYLVTTPFSGLQLDGPFFVAWNFVSFSGAGGQVITPLWDSVARPLGRQFVANGGELQDFTDFFIAGETSWVDVTVAGNVVQPPPESQPVPALSVWALAVLLATMLACGLFMRRRFDA